MIFKILMSHSTSIKTFYDAHIRQCLTHINSFEHLICFCIAAPPGTERKLDICALLHHNTGTNNLHVHSCYGQNWLHYNLLFTHTWQPQHEITYTSCWTILHDSICSRALLLDHACCILSITWVIHSVSAVWYDAYVSDSVCKWTFPDNLNKLLYLKVWWETAVTNSNHAQ